MVTVPEVRGMEPRPETLVDLEGGRWACLARGRDGDALLVGGGAETRLVARPEASPLLRELVPWLRPRPCGTATSFGFGDRLGRATPGHVRALRAAAVAPAPVLAQQSARELERTGRTFADALDAATWGAFAAGWRGGFGADADHLRTPEEVRAAVAAGYTSFTLDPSAELGAPVPWDALEDDPRSLRRRYPGAPADELDAAVALLGAAIARAAALARELPPGVDLEVSIDETHTPTTPFQHRFVAAELRRLDVPFTALAPRFEGAWHKGVDVRGDAAPSLRAHAAVAGECGHKLSIHSGSDKLSLYPVLAGAGCAVHVKTSGTSYLEALRVVAVAEAETFRAVLDVAAAAFAEERRSYSLGADARVPGPRADGELASLLDDPGARQALHVTYGAVLRDGPLAARVLACLDREAEAYAAALERHLGRHLDLLAA